MKNLSELNEEIPEKLDLKQYKYKKLRVIIIYPDGSYKEGYKPLNSSYKITVDNKVYQVVPKCIIRGKYPLICYFYNNPAPIYPKYQKPSYIPKNKSFNAITKIETRLDGEMLETLINSNVVNKMYKETRMTVKQFLILAGSSLVIILILLHVFGVIDLSELFGAITSFFRAG